MVREPVVSGKFYSGTKKALLEEVSKLVDKNASREPAIGALSPHAGYMYSGAVAGRTLSSMDPKASYIIVGPNHTDLGWRFSISASKAWKTPLGEVQIDKRLADDMIKSSRYLRFDELAHEAEHSVEVQLPLLQALNGDFKVVPMVVAYAGVDVYREIGHSIAAAVKKFGAEKDVAIIASSDMTHYESAETARKKDSAALEAILELDEAKLMERVEKLGITMCGYAPAAIMLSAAKELGAKSARLVEYRTSGDVTGDDSSVVGYAGVIIK